LAREQMVYVKALVVGIVGALLFAIAWAWAALQVPIWWQMWQQRNEGGGVGASYVGSGSILLAALIGFLLGFLWTLRRASNRLAPPA
jgi:ABC-type phosphate transport system permease subunit